MERKEMKNGEEGGSPASDLAMTLRKEGIVEWIPFHNPEILTSHFMPFYVTSFYKKCGIVPKRKTVKEKNKHDILHHW